MYLQKVISKKLEKIWFVGVLKVTDEKRSGIGSVNQRYEFVDPDPYKNITDPDHWFKGTVLAPFHSL
jgi:hypothetical protein